MGLKRTAIFIVVAVWGAAIGFRYSAVTVQAGAAAQQPAGGERKIWEGVYTAGAGGARQAAVRGLLHPMSQHRADRIRARSRP